MSNIRMPIQEQPHRKAKAKMPTRNLVKGLLVMNEYKRVSMMRSWKSHADKPMMSRGSMIRE